MLAIRFGAYMAFRWCRYTRKSCAPGRLYPRDPRGLPAAAIMLACLSTPLHAQSSNFSGEVALASQLVDRGLAITPATPVLQGSVSLALPEGWSLGLAGGVEARSPGRLVVALARVSHFWALSSDWQAQASLLYYDYRADDGRGIPDRADASLHFTYRDTLTFGLSAVRVSGNQDRRLLGAADLELRWPLTRHVSLSTGAGIAQTAVASYEPGSYQHYGHDAPIELYGYGHLGLAWSDGPWHLQIGRNMNSLGERRVYGTQASSNWVATLSWSF